MITTILSFIGILLVLVLIHELGHFIVAKIFGVKVEEFGFGFPPRVWGKKIGETIYSVNWLPIGGFVKLFGEDEAGAGSLKISNTQHPISNTEKKRAFFARPVWQRAAIVFAGVVMNFLLAVGIWTYLSSVQGIPTPGKDVVITAVASKSPAQKAGLVTGEVILAVDGQKIKDAQGLITYTKQHTDKSIRLQVKKENGTTQEVRLTPRSHYPSDQGPMGIGIGSPVVYKKYAWYQAPIVGFQESVSQVGQMFGVLGLIWSQIVFHGQIPEGLAGPVGIARLTGEVEQIGAYAVLSLVALLSLNLAVINVLPIPALDGGRLFFILWEGLTGRKVSPKVEGYIHAAGMAVILTLMVFITLHDVMQLASGQPLLPH